VTTEKCKKCCIMTREKRRRGIEFGEWEGGSFKFPKIVESEIVCLLHRMPLDVVTWPH